LTKGFYNRNKKPRERSSLICFGFCNKKKKKKKKRKGDKMKDKRREVLYLVADLHQTLKELIRAVEELQLEIDNLLEQGKGAKKWQD
jgi:hypothetical protein